MRVEFKEWLDIRAHVLGVWGQSQVLAFPGLAALGAPQQPGSGSILTFAEALSDGSGELLVARIDTKANVDQGMPDVNAGWNSCRLSHYGYSPIVPTKTLPDWDPRNMGVVGCYERWALSVLELVEKDYDIHRIEGAVPFVDRNSQIAWDFVRIVHVENVLTNVGPHGSRDWIAMGTWSVLRSGKQEGGGHGPPH